MLNVFRRSQNGGQEASGPGAIRLLALTRDAEEWESLQHITEAENWILFWAHTSSRAHEIVARYHVPIVICDRDLPGEDWRDVVASFSRVRPPVCSLLASAVADEYLWRELVHNRGFEILTKPFDASKVVRTVRFAINWRGWTHDQPATA